MLTLVHGKGDPDASFMRLEFKKIRRMVEFEKRNKDVSIGEPFRPKVLNQLHNSISMQM